MPEKLLLTDAEIEEAKRNIPSIIGAWSSKAIEEDRAIVRATALKIADYVESMAKAADFMPIINILHDLAQELRQEVGK